MSATSVTAKPASANNLAVPPVDNNLTPLAASAVASSNTPVLSETEINKMLEDAEKYAAVDKDVKEKAEIKLQADQLVLGELKDAKFDDETLQEEADKLLVILREAIESDNYDLMKEYSAQARSLISKAQPKEPQN